MAASIEGIGTAAPEHAIQQLDAAGQSLAICAASRGAQRLARSVYANAGIDKRHSVLLTASTNGDPAEQAFFTPADEAAPFGPTTGDRMAAYRAAAAPLAERAARAALADAGVEPAEVTHVVLVSCSGFAAPGVDVALIQQIGLPPTVGRTSVGFMGCHGALNGLRVAEAFCRADPAAVVLVAAVELCTLHFQYDWTPQRIIANSLFADGAAAAVVRYASDSDAPRLAGNLSEVVPGSLDAMSWSIGDHGFDMTLSTEVPGLIEAHLPSRIEKWLASADLRAEDIAAWAIHPGGPRILTACEAALGLDDTALRASRGVLADYGNMSSPTVLFVLDRLRQQGAITPCVLLAFGPGLAIEAILLR